MLSSSGNADEDEYHARKVTMCVFWEDGKLGAAIHNAESTEVEILNDIVDVRPHFRFLRSLFFQIQPTAVIASSVNSKFAECLKILIKETNEENGKDIRLILYSHKNFRYEVCKDRILNMRIACADTMTTKTKENAANRLYTLINFECVSTVSALGVLLHALDREGAQSVACGVLPTVSKTICCVKNIKLLDKLLWMDSCTFKALEIFSSSKVPMPGFDRWERPCQLNESATIFQVMNRCTTKLGFERMRMLLGHPIKDMETLKKRQDVVEFCVNPENGTILHCMIQCLKNITSLSGVIVTMVNGNATATDWRRFYRTLYHAVLLSQICSKEELAFLAEANVHLESGTLEDICNLISTLIDFDLSRGDYVAVKEGNFEELDKLKSTMPTLQSMLHTLAEREMAHMPDRVKSCWIEQIPNIGYVVVVPITEEMRACDMEIIPGAFYLYECDGSLYYKTEQCKEMDDYLGDTSGLIERHEVQIVYQIVNVIKENAVEIINLIDYVALLDCLISFGVAATELNMTRPVLTQEKEIRISKGRHVLRQLQIEEFVPNDYESRANSGLVKILTAPNGSGKSVYLKQVASIVYLAHVGSFVPAAEATVGMLDFLHVGNRPHELISTAVSSFMLDLRQMHSSLFNSTPNTLVILDEFGEGSNNADGIALLATLVESFISRGEFCPHVIVSTHFHSLPNLVPQTDLVRKLTIKYAMKDRFIVPMFRVENGSVDTSCAFYVARGVGVPNFIVERAQQVN